MPMFCVPCQLTIHGTSTNANNDIDVPGWNIHDVERIGAFGGRTAQINVVAQRKIEVEANDYNQAVEIALGKGLFGISPVGWVEATVHAIEIAPGASIADLDPDLPSFEPEYIAAMGM